MEDLLIYSSIDPIITRWANDHGLKISNRFGGLPRRFCYISGGHSESFQVSIEPPVGKEVLVNVWSVETEDDAELHHAWTVPIGELQSTLEQALAKIEEWKSRPRNYGVTVS